MALSRRNTSRFAASIWPGFVDAMTALILVLFFVLSIFMIVQFVLRDTITGQETEIDAQNEEIVEQNRALGELSVQVATLADALGLERSRADTQEALVATLSAERDAAQARIASFEDQVADLLSRNAEVAGALETARGEIDAQAEAARLAQARREALEAMAASLRDEIAGLEATTATQTEALSEAEAQRVAEAAAAEALRARLADADVELTAMTLNLEAERKKAEDTLTMLAAAEAARDALEGSEAEALTEAERRAAELAQARALLADQTEISAEAQRQVALLNQQTAALRAQLDSLQGLLDAARADDVASQVRIESLGADLNAALAKVAAEQSARADLEARERARLEAEAQDLTRYRSEFFGRMREILGEREGVQVVGDRFVFPSEVLFDPGSANLAPDGRAQVARVAEVINDIADDIPEGIDWILRVDGHTDSVPVAPGGAFADNWELSQARALSVVQYMIDAEGIPANRLAATGFGEFQPVDTGSSPEALARNRRIELKFTER
jgi:chemotaxis protein MotB